MEFHLCPLCRFVFRFPQLKKGERPPGVICPSCRYLVRINLGDATSIKSAKELLREAERQKNLNWEETQNEVKNKDGKIVHIAVYFLLLCLVLVGGLVGWKLLNPKKNTQLQPKNKIVKQALLASGLEADRKLTLPVIEAYINTTTAKEALPYFYFSNEDLKQDFEKLFKAPVGIEIVSEGEYAAESDRVLFYELRSSFGEYRKCFIRLLDDKPLIDWQSWQGVNTVTLERFVTLDSMKELSPRIILSRSNNYNFTFTEEDWVSLKMNETSSTRIYYAYVKRSETELLDQLKKAGVTKKASDVIVQLKKHEDGTLIISKLLAKGWFKE